MDFDQLRAFVSIAYAKNFTKSSQHLHISQSTITARIKSLEESLGQQLFYRTNRSVNLSPAGMAFLPLAERMLALANESKLVVQVNAQLKERLVIAGNSSFWIYKLYPLVHAFRKRYPNLMLQIVSGNSSQEVIQYLLDEIVDIGVVYNPPKELKIEVLPLFDDELVLVGTPRFQREIQPDDFNSQEYIHIDWGPSFKEWFFEQMEPGYIPAFRINHTSFMMHLLLDGHGFGFMLKSIVQPYIDNKELVLLNIPFSSAPPDRHASVIYLKSRKNHPITQRGLEMLNLK